MEKLKKDALIETYRAAYDAIPQEAFELDLRVTIRTMQALAEAKPVSPQRLTEIWEMPLEQVRALLRQAVASGRAEVDDQGNLVGGVLSLLPTRHRITIEGKQLFAWCAYDAIYAPGVVGKTAQIVSDDPVTGDTIRLTITPVGVSEVQPKETVVSVVGAETDVRGGPASPRCSQMLFFGARETAERWLQDHPAVSILTVEEVFEIAELFQIEPARRLRIV
jgi:alkylmercury lyase